jgi:hypothetical protein
MANEGCHFFMNLTFGQSRSFLPMDLINLSAEPIDRLHLWIPHNQEAERIVFTGCLPEQIAFIDRDGRAVVPEQLAKVCRNRPDKFDEEFDRVVRWAAESSAAIHEAIHQVLAISILF